MRLHPIKGLPLVALLLGAAVGPGLAQEGKDHAKDEAVLAKNGEAFIAAFHKADAKALAALWTEEGEYVHQTGRRVKGRDAIEKAFQQFFKEHKGLKARIDSHSLRFVSPDVAIEEGVTEVFAPDGAPPSRSNYTIVHAKSNGKWLLCSVRDTPYTPPSNYEHLRALQGLIGEWASEAGKGEVERLSFGWSENQNFIVGTMSTTSGNVAVASAKVLIGWDPEAKRIRSWMFDAGGGFGEGAWSTSSSDGKKWLIKTTSVHQDGAKASATFAVTFVDPETLLLQVTNRSVAGKSLPESKEVSLKRVK
jgi:uncharacterized protein (TIGR02246 family)